jgi:hypothetical protein
MRLVILTLVLSISLLGQTFSPKQPVDFSAVTTKPIQVGTSAPGTCAVGQVYFDSDATAGQNLYLCTATNTWTQLTGTGGSGGTGIVICTGGGTSTAYTCTASGLTVATGAMVLFIPHVNSGASPGLAVNGGSSAPIIRRNGNGVVADELKEDIEYILTYTGSAWRLTQPDVTVGTSLTGVLSVTDGVIEKEAGLCSTTDACAPTGGWDFASSAFLRIKRGTGAPSSADCNEAAEVGRIYARTDAETAKATFYGCSNTAAATYAWEVIGDGGSGSGLADPGSNGIIKRTSLNTTAPAAASDVSGLFSGTGDYLKSDGTKGTPSGSGNVTAGGTLTLNAPVIGAGTTAVSVGTRTGNTTEFVTQSGAKTAGKQATYDANGNLIASAYDVGASGSGATSITEYITFSGGIQTGDNDKDHVGFQQISGGPALSVFPASPSPMGTTALSPGVSTEVQIYTVLPPGWTGAISMGLFTSLAANNTGAGTFVLAVRTACATPGTDSMEIASSSMNAVQTITETIAGGAFQYKTGKYSTLTLDTTGCAAGDVLFVRFKRDPTTYTSDNAPDLLLLGYARLAVTRTL